MGVSRVPTTDLGLHHRRYGDGGEIRTLAKNPPRKNDPALVTSEGRGGWLFEVPSNFLSPAA